MIPSSTLDRLLNLALSPALWLSVLLAFIYSILFTLWQGGSWGRAAPGGGIRDLGRPPVGVLAGSSWLRIGDVQLLWGSLGALATLFLGRRLWQPRQDDLPVP